MKLGSLDDGRNAVLKALDQRLEVAAKVLLPDVRLAPGTPSGRIAELLPELLAAAGGVPGPRVWLLLTAMTGAFPVATDVVRLARRIALDAPDDLAFDLLDRLNDGNPRFSPELPMELVSDRVVVETHGCATSRYHTGIQRVVRSVVPRWAAEHDIVCVADTAAWTGFRRLSEREEARVHRYGINAQAHRQNRATFPLLVPWQTTVVLAEIPERPMRRRLAALAQYSGNSVTAVGYDLIPVTSGHLLSQEHSRTFTDYLELIKHCHRVACISRSATDEFAGFVHMLAAQGIAGPRVVEVELADQALAADAPTESGADTPSSRRPSGRRQRPIVVMPGRPEVHKNVMGALHAARRLWREGLDFEVVLFGGPKRLRGELEHIIKEITAEGRPLFRSGWITDQEMWQQIRTADFMVFASLHEGYGLPVAEALSLGVPVITSNYGSQREIGERGGCVLVDPRREADIAEAMRTLITQPDRLTALRAEIAARPQRPWDDYAHDAWSFLVEGARQTA